MGNNPSKKDKPSTSTSTTSASSIKKKPEPTGTTSNYGNSGSSNNGAHVGASHTTSNTSSNNSNSHNSGNSSKPSNQSQNTPSNSSKSASTDKEDKNKRLEEFFEKYKEPETNAIGPDGVVQLCKDIGVEPEDIIVLVLAWRLKAQSMGYFTRQEFITGLSDLGIDSLQKLQAHLPNFKKDLEDQNNFKDIYRFAFVFAKEGVENKILELGNACDMMSLVLGTKYPHISNLVDYLLNHQKTYRGINMDQWLSIFEFVRTINVDTSNYDENGAWPVLIDEYVEYYKKK